MKEAHAFNEGTELYLKMDIRFLNMHELIAARLRFQHGNILKMMDEFGFTTRRVRRAICIIDIAAYLAQHL